MPDERLRPLAFRLFLVAFLASACGCSVDPKPSLKLAYVPVGDSAPLYVGVQENVFSRYNIDVQIQPIGDGPTIITAIVRGDLDGGSAGITPVINAFAKGAPIQIVEDGGHVVDRPTPTVALVVAGHSPITSVRDLAGHSIGYFGPKTIEDALISVALEKSGVPRSTVELKPMPQDSKIPLLIKNEVQAVLLLEPFVTQALSQHGARVLMSSQQMIPDYQQALIVFSDRALSEKAETIRIFSKAYKEVVSYVRDHPDAARSAIGRQLQMRFQPPLLQRLSLLGWDSRIDVGRIQRTHQVMLDYGVVSWRGDLGTKVASGY